MPTCRSAPFLHVLVTLTFVACAGTPGSQGTSPGATSAASASPAATPRVTAAPTVAPSLAPGVLEVFDVPFRPSGILAAGDAIWAEDHAQTGKVYAIDPDTGEIIATIDLRRPCDVAATGGRLWAADYDTGKLVAVDLETREATGEEITGLRGPCGVVSIDDVLWLAVDVGLARVDPATGETTVIELEGGAAFPGPGAPVWAAMYESGELLRVDAAAGTVALRLDPPGPASWEHPIAVGLDSVWFGNGASNRIYRLDATTGAQQAEIEAGSPARILITDDGVWSTSYNLGSVQRIDPSTNEPVFRVRLGGNINGLTEGFGSIWVADTLAGLIYRIDPNATGLPG